MRSLSILAAALAFGFACTGNAQPAGQAGASSAAPASSQRPAYRARSARTPTSGRWGPGYTPGWAMMTPAERDEHHKQMAQARTYDECRKVFDEHRALMQQRATERGIAMRAPRRDACRGLPK